MIHYHGTPVGGTRQEAARFLVGRHALVPFLRQEDLGPVLEFAQSFMLDNSAFTHWRAGHGRIDFDGYFDWVQSLYRHPAFDFCLIPDVIDGTEEDNAELVMKWVRTGTKALGAPVWHMHESLEWLEYLVSHFALVAIGSSGQWKQPGTNAWWRRMSDAMRVACDADGRPRTRLHGLRMLDPDIFGRLPLRSADSTNAVVNSSAASRFGQYVPATSSQRSAVIADRIERFSSPAEFMDAEQADMFG